MTGTIELRDLRIRCIAGIHPQERLFEQDIYLDVRLELDFAAAAASEDIRHTVDYTIVAERLTNLVVTRKYMLIETLATEGAQFILSSWPQVERVGISVKKPSAVPHASNTIASVERAR